MNTSEKKFNNDNDKQIIGISLHLYWKSSYGKEYIDIDAVIPICKNEFNNKKNSDIKDFNNSLETGFIEKKNIDIDSFIKILLNDSANIHNYSDYNCNKHLIRNVVYYFYLRFIHLEKCKLVIEMIDI